MTAGPAIMFEAFDRQEEHRYELQLGTWPHDSEGPRYSADQGLGAGFGGGKPAADRRATTIDSLDLDVGRAFGYWFDFGGDWWHQINVEAIVEEVPGGQLPRVTKRVGRSPPQCAKGDESEGGPPSRRTSARLMIVGGRGEGNGGRTLP